MALIALNTIDALQTSHAVGSGFAYEVNPFMAYLIESLGMQAAMVFKLWFVPTLAVYMLAKGYEWAVKIICIPYLFVCLNGAFLIAVHHAGRH